MSLFCVGFLCMSTTALAQEQEWTPLTPEPDEPEPAAQPDPKPSPKPRASPQPKRSEPDPAPRPAEEPRDVAPREVAPSPSPVPRPPPVVPYPVAREPLSPQPDGEYESEDDAVRFRGGIMAGFGGLILTASAGTLDFIGPTLVGNLGVQIIDEFALYASLRGLSLWFTEDDDDNLIISGGVGASLVAEATIIDHIFVGAGPSIAYFGEVEEVRPGLHARVGGYPFVGFGDDGIRRKGFMLGFDLRAHFVSGIALIEPAGMIGYEAF